MNPPRAAAAHLPQILPLLLYAVLALLAVALMLLVPSPAERIGWWTPKGSVFALWDVLLFSLIFLAPLNEAEGRWRTALLIAFTGMIGFSMLSIAYGPGLVMPLAIAVPGVCAVGVAAMCWSRGLSRGAYYALAGMMCFGVPLVMFFAQELLAVDVSWLGLLSPFAASRLGLNNVDWIAWALAAWGIIALAGAIAAGLVSLSRRWSKIVPPLLAAGLCLLGRDAFALRAQVGIQGAFPAGEWVNCRVEGLGPGVTSVRVELGASPTRDEEGPRLSYELPVREGVAQGPILLPDNVTQTTVRVGNQPFPLRRLMDTPLREVRSRLPVLFIGKDTPNVGAIDALLEPRATYVLRIDVEDFLRMPEGAWDWVRVLVLGEMTEAQRESLKAHFGRIAQSVVIMKSAHLRGWLDEFDWTRRGDLAVLNAKLAPVLSVPRGPARPEVFDLFGPADWPRDFKLRLVVLFGGLLLLTAAAVAVEGHIPRGRYLTGVVVLGAAIACVALAAPPQPFVVQQAGLVQGLAGADLAGQTDFLRLSVVGDRLPERLELATRPGWTPVEREAGYGHWDVKADGTLVVGGWHAGQIVALRHRVVPVPRSEDLVDRFTTDGTFAWTEPGKRLPFGAFVEQRFAGTSDVEVLRRHLLDDWQRRRPPGGRFLLGWDGPRLCVSSLPLP